MRSNYGHLVDILEGTAALEHRRRRSPDEDKRSFSETGVLKGREGVRDPGPGRYDGHSGDPGEASCRVGREGDIALVTQVKNVDSASFRLDENGGDVTANQGENTGHAVAKQHLRDPGAAVFGA